MKHNNHLKQLSRFISDRLAKKPLTNEDVKNLSDIKIDQNWLSSIGKKARGLFDETNGTINEQMISNLNREIEKLHKALYVLQAENALYKESLEYILNGFYRMGEECCEDTSDIRNLLYKLNKR